MKQMLSFIVCLCSIYSFGQTNKTYSQAEFSIQYPADWKLDSSKQVAAAIFFYSPLEDASDHFSENVNIMIQNLKGQAIDLNKYQLITEKQVAALAESGKILSSKIEKAPNAERYLVEYLMTMKGSKLHIKSICYIKRETAYLVTLTTTQESFEKYSQIGNALLNSFIVR